MNTKPQKSKQYAPKKTYDKWDGYFLDDVDCKNCLHWKGKKRGCPLPECSYDDEKLAAIKNGRTNRKRGL